MNKLEELISKCKCGVFVSVNEHRDYYQSVEDSICELEQDEIDQISKDVYAEMVKRDSLVCIIFYPDTPIGSYRFYHYDLGECLDMCLSTFVKQEGGK